MYQKVLKYVTNVLRIVKNRKRTKRNRVFIYPCSLSVCANNTYLFIETKEVLDMILGLCFCIIYAVIAVAVWKDYDNNRVTNVSNSEEK